ncbi:protein of unknown function [Evansella caseinilytica]|uniref:DUF4397 domain-containing protein n=1 Tax=Evansella caseinilytica TaxID=1503961 RepID=A0A1H3NN06_9BACI|nr:DUF4397 domain-containing protein [Evansella caseinilytica]SDY90296.1 protein of unknown function [Evansella caseinilytica]
MKKTALLLFAFILGSCFLGDSLGKAASTANIRIFHASTDAPNLDVYFDKEQMFSEVVFKEMSPYQTVSDGGYKMKLFPEGADPAKDKPLLTKKLKLKADRSYTMAVIGEQSRFDILLITDGEDSQTERAGIRFIHLSPDLPAVDVFADKEELYSKLAYKKTGDYIKVEQKTVNIQFREGNQSNAIYEIPNLELLSGNSYTVFILGLLSGEPGLDVVITLDTK